ncbi:hypothetical protein LCGC14_1148550, partial [marine sediment metagenome]
MKATRTLRIATTIVAACCLWAPAWGQTVKAKEAAAEAALTNCDLEGSLRLWREVLAADANHKRAKYVVGKLTAQALDLDSHLDVIDTLIDQGVAKGTEALLDAAGRRAATATQKARVLYLRGRLARLASKPAQARASFTSAVKLHADTEWGARSAIALAAELPRGPDLHEPRRLLTAVAGNAKLTAAVREEARLGLLLLDSAGWTPQRRIAALRKLLAG